MFVGCAAAKAHYKLWQSKTQMQDFRTRYVCVSIRVFICVQIIEPNWIWLVLDEKRERVICGWCLETCFNECM